MITLTGIYYEKDYHIFSRSKFSHNSDKVERLKSAFPDDYVHAFPINIDPDIAIPELENNINNVLIDHLNEEIILFL